MAYATDDSASEENTGSARILGSSVCSRLLLGHGAAHEDPLDDDDPATPLEEVRHRAHANVRPERDPADAQTSRWLADPAVPDAGLGHDQPGRLGVVAELLAQRPHVGAQVGGLGSVPLTPHLPQEPLVGEELAWVRHQRLEQPVLGRRQVHLLAVAGDESPREVDLEVPEGHAPAAAGSSGCLRRIAARARASSSSIPNGFVT